MSENRKQMIDALIKKYGFEADATVDFAMFCEKYPTPAYDRIVKILFNTLTDYGIEIKKLNLMLSGTNANYILRNINDDGYRILLYDKDGKIIADAIYYKGSRGYECGLLETLIIAESEYLGAEGYLTAEQVFNRWKTFI